MMINWKKIANALLIMSIWASHHSIRHNLTAGQPHQVNNCIHSRPLITQQFITDLKKDPENNGMFIEKDGKSYLQRVIVIGRPRVWLYNKSIMRHPFNGEKPTFPSKPKFEPPNLVHFIVRHNFCIWLNFGVFREHYIST